MEKCYICGREFEKRRGLSYHISQTHSMTYKDYYDTYIKGPNDGKCAIDGKPTIWIGDRYKECCSSKCTCLLRYGVEHNSQIPEVKSKMHTKEAHEKVKETNLKKYSVACAFQREDVKEHSKIASRTKEAREKARKTCQDKYGVDSPLCLKENHEKGVAASKTEETKNKIKQTNLKKYGVTSGVQTNKSRERANTPEAKAKRNESIRRTNLERRGTEWPAQNKEIFEKQMATNIAKYGVPHPILTESAKQVKAENRLNTIKTFELDNYTSRQSLIEKYGQGWLTLEIPSVIESNIAFVSNEYLPIIEEYFNRDRGPHSSSAKEKEIQIAVQSVYSSEIHHNNRLIISPLELDIYLPDIKLAVEYNGVYWHSTEYKDKNYHLNKSLLCREKGIRLIHIYEFEDLNTQIKFLIELINGTDNYPKEDFNKNNLISTIPTSEIIYNDGRYAIYGAGKLID